ncbi:hypothetical protein WN59_10080 [Salinicoccus sediminis]|uniref:Uncharacterized protein n=1 Tax=Salinicoccus sediminis TaxID=1432562 RepID=A0A0M2SM58_9STAP|nr:hypothetical protein [Salinicoccus sediminis]KKK33942.1 hypothetical protein WN59_10080 [Salinicoccus sediminis]
MNDLRLLLDLSREEDNLYIETEKSCRAMFLIDGFASYDGHVDSFTDEPKVITLEADGKNILSSITQVDVDYMLTINVITFEETHVFIHEFENQKLRNIEEVSEKLYEIPLKETSSIKNESIANTLSTGFYALEYDDSQDDFPLSTNRLLVFLYAEKERVYRSGILDNEEYDPFIGEINRFMEEYDVEFEQSEGTELILSTIYLMREYLNQDWNQIYELLENG